MQFPENDPYWLAALSYVRDRFGEQVSCLGPNEFHEQLYGTYPYLAANQIDLEKLEVFILHKGMMDRLDDKVLAWIIKTKYPAWGNEVFAIFSTKKNIRTHGKHHFEPVYIEGERRKTHPTPLQENKDEGRIAIAVTTYNRPRFLEMTLSSLAATGLRILVVNDGSSSEHKEEYARIYRRYGVSVIEMPENRGLPTAVNIALSYWLANASVEWISYFQDDVEIHPQLFALLEKVQDPLQRPLLTGRHDPLYKVYGEEEINGVKIMRQRTCSGMHLHGHRDYWEKVLPIPTPYLGAPKKRRYRGSDTDWWVTCWAPHSVAKQGRYVSVIPGYARTFSVKNDDSTWGNNASRDDDPALRPVSPEQHQPT